ncbi:hypothetical protein N7497_000666 [Penicillium chrysogenum]|nr:hypothetical protein N7497_000666 [Penicillium chrysogenum]
MAHQTDAQSPASKKLGSKLKKSKDSTGEERSPDTQESTRSKEDPKSDKKDKKDKKKRKSVPEDATPATDGEVKKKKKRRHTEDDNEQNGKDEESHKKKKKRVSFGPGTKEFDGDSESESDDAESNDAAATDGADADTEDATDKAIEEMKKRKREKKKQRKNGTTSADGPIHETPILSYLSHYHRARATWKFQKNKETNLFKHLYSLEHVPSKYNTSLLAYMQGLKGDAAKVRMSNAARDVIKADMDLDKPKDDEEAENQEPATSPEYLEAINAFRECLPKGTRIWITSTSEKSWRETFKSRQRAELVFFAVAGKLFSAEDLKKPKSKPKATEPPVNKKRKNRTMVVDISSSEDSDDDAPASKKAASKPAPDSDDETSSSGGSSSSSSDSDSDSDDKTSTTPAPAKQSAASTPSSSAPSGVAMSNKQSKAAKRKEKFVPVREEKPKPAVPKKTQKRKLRTAQIEISSSESDSE